MQLACQSLGGEVKPGPQPRVRPGRSATSTSADGLFAGVPTETVVWMSHGDQVQHGQRRLRPAGRHRHLPARRRPAPQRGRSTACSSTPRSATRRTAASILRNFLYDVCGCQGTVEDGRRSSSETVEELRQRDRQAPRHLRAVRRRRFVGDGGPARHGPSARRSRASSWTTGCCARARSRRCSSTFRDHFQADLHVVDARRPLPATPWPASPTRRRSGSIIGHVFIDVFKDEAQRIDERQVPGAGHALPRRDRERRLGRTARRRTSRCTTTSAACRRSWASS